jgi:hypothetical protein
VLTFRVLEAHWKVADMDKYIVKLTEEERAELLALIRVEKKAANKLMHARVLLSADENDTKLKQKTDEEISSEMHVSSKTVARIRQRFVEEGLVWLDLRVCWARAATYSRRESVNRCTRTVLSLSFLPKLMM